MPGDQKVVHFPLPPRYWDTPGDAPSFQLWAAQFDNYIFSVDLQHLAANKMMDEFKNRLLFLLFGTEGISSFACMLEALNIASMSFANFYAAAKSHLQPTISLIHAFFDFQSRCQQTGEPVVQFRNALYMLLVDCEIATEDECKKLLAHQLVFGSRDSATLQKLLTLKEMNLESIFAEMESQEKVNENTRVIHGGGMKGKGAELSVCVAQKCKNSGRNSKSSNTSTVSNQKKQPLCCFGCGKLGHHVYVPNCPAKQAECGLCHRVGHYKAFCCSKGHESSPGGEVVRKGGLLVQISASILPLQGQRHKIHWFDDAKPVWSHVWHSGAGSSRLWG